MGLSEDASRLLKELKQLIVEHAECAMEPTDCSIVEELEDLVSDYEKGSENE